MSLHGPNSATIDVRKEDEMALDYRDYRLSQQDRRNTSWQVDDVAAHMVGARSK